jgi:hypothetical protein
MEITKIMMGKSKWLHQDVYKRLNKLLILQFHDKLSFKFKNILYQSLVMRSQVKVSTIWTIYLIY